VVAVASTVVVSSFLAWHDLYGQNQKQQADINQLKDDKTNLAGVIKERQAKIDAQKDQINHLKFEAGVVTRSGGGSTPREPEPKITLEHSILKPIRAEDGLFYAVQLTVLSDKEIPSPDIEVRTTSPIAGMEFGRGANGIDGDSEEGKIVWRFTITPKLIRGEPWTIILLGKDPIDIVYAKRVQ
jgi:hypothetical protein